ncbi:acyltransferase [Draconibacterium sp. IB214405]|uniref:acyltransferase n=1 Tax=Draconibacterium sp. IB214405 TaxID=3097352 RepID=UPI002A1149A7|nr:acyltransferase [Draconibacterium sp. IB214405]MDX8339296.1 acyltransferase [Draconibacterium sp. IB214405]
MQYFFKIINYAFSVRSIHYILNSVKFFKVKILRKCHPKVYGLINLNVDGQLLCGTSIRINSSSKFNIIGGDTRTNILIGKEAKMVIGNNVGISNSTFVCRNQIILEDNVLIGGNCKFYDTDFHSLEFDNRMKPFLNGKPDTTIKSAPIIVKNGAWIGGHCIILKGVIIGECSIIGAGSVVSKNIPANEVWAGNPAKFVRKTTHNTL